MKRFSTLACTLLILLIIFAGAKAASPSEGDLPDQPDLLNIVSKLDADLFNSFNHCASPDQLQKHASYFAPKLEFYHDKGGVTWSRKDYMANVKNNVCGKFRRELITGSLKVFPIKDYGAIEQGRHEFCWIESGKCFGEAEFFMLWHRADNHWVVTRSFSYGHSPIE